METGDGARLHSTTLNRSAERKLRPGLLETRQLVTDQRINTQRPGGPITSLCLFKVWTSRKNFFKEP